MGRREERREEEADRGSAAWRRRGDGSSRDEGRKERGRVREGDARARGRKERASFLGKERPPLGSDQKQLDDLSAGSGRDDDREGDEAGRERDRFYARQGKGGTEGERKRRRDDGREGNEAGREREARGKRREQGAGGMEDRDGQQRGGGGLTRRREEETGTDDGKRMTGGRSGSSRR